MKKFRKNFTIQTKFGSYKVVIWWDDRDKTYLVKAVNLPDVVTFGKTIKEAKEMAKDAIGLYCDCVIDENKLIIDDTSRIFGHLPKRRVVALAR